VVGLASPINEKIYYRFIIASRGTSVIYSIKNVESCIATEQMAQNIFILLCKSAKYFSEVQPSEVQKEEPNKLTGERPQRHKFLNSTILYILTTQGCPTQLESP
jgi:hypothetical protein